MSNLVPALPGFTLPKTSIGRLPHGNVGTDLPKFIPIPPASNGPLPVLTPGTPGVGGTHIEPIPSTGNQSNGDTQKTDTTIVGEIQNFAKDITINAFFIGIFLVLLYVAISGNPPQQIIRDTGHVITNGVKTAGTIAAVA